MGYDLRVFVAGSGPGLYVLPSTVGYINHDCTRVAGPAYSLLRRPSEGKPGRGGGGRRPLGASGASSLRQEHLLPDGARPYGGGLLAPRLAAWPHPLFSPEEQIRRGTERRVGPRLPSTLCTFLAAWLLRASVSSSVSSDSTSFAQLSGLCGHRVPGAVR